ncbi:deoxyguanosinetriphosphate triphosphohydrolase [Geitlerinema sp. P-1104]|nr:deoxyguanosinetriphosphate triphosphohydrolase [Geitlerinema sp. P-1104]
MNWDQLLTRKRVGKKHDIEDNAIRTCFHQDYDRIVFSSAFRRLQNKTQVYSLSKNDYVRTRLTHSLEVSCVGRSLGNYVGQYIIGKYKSLQDSGFHSSDFGSIVSAACLAHDIGNPPFGHVGEKAISSGFKKWNNSIKEQLSEAETFELENFEGNAQGWRVLTKIEMPSQHRQGGMRLTYPVLASFSKYPVESIVISKDINNNPKKYGFLTSERDSFQEIANSLGLLKKHQSYCWWSRHPLTFLVEAADDICYRIIDIEDGFRMKFITFQEAKEMLNRIAKIETKKLNNIATSEAEKIKYLRAVAINNLVTEAVTTFRDHEKNILEGAFRESLTSVGQYAENLEYMKQETIKNVFDARNVLLVQVAGYKILESLFFSFASSVFSQDYKDKMVLKLLPEQYQPQDGESPYEKILKINDYISGMTDAFATHVFQTINGMSL